MGRIPWCGAWTWTSELECYVEYHLNTLCQNITQRNQKVTGALSNYAQRHKIPVYSGHLRLRFHPSLSCSSYAFHSCLQHRHRIQSQTWFGLVPRRNVHRTFKTSILQFVTEICVEYIRVWLVFYFIFAFVCLLRLHNLMLDVSHEGIYKSQLLTEVETWVLHLICAILFY